MRRDLFLRCWWLGLGALCGVSTRCWSGVQEGGPTGSKLGGSATVVCGGEVNSVNAERWTSSLVQNS